MIIGVAQWELSFPGAQSLKDKRRVLKSLKDRIGGKYNVSVAETNHHDLWQRAELSVAVVGSDRAFVDSVLDSVDGVVDGETRVIITGTRRELW